MRARTLLALAPAALLPLGFAAGPAMAANGQQTYTAQLNPVPLNGGSQDGSTGSLTLTMNGSQATISEHVSGLAATFGGGAYPHVQHIHGGAMGVCPPASADKSGDGVISTTEGAPSYGGILTTLSVKGDTSPAAGTNIKIAPSGGSFTYTRTIKLDSATMQAIKAGTAVIVVHGLNPASAAKGATTEKSDLVPSLPLAATSPVLCGALTASQMSAMPSGGVNTGGTAPMGPAALPLYVLGGLALAGSGAMIARRRVNSTTAGR
jgi:hypothetical protein